MTLSLFVFTEVFATTHLARTGVFVTVQVTQVCRYATGCIGVVSCKLVLLTDIDCCDIMLVEAHQPLHYHLS